MKKQESGEAKKLFDLFYLFAQQKDKTDKGGLEKGEVVRRRGKNLSSGFSALHKIRDNNWQFEKLCDASYFNTRTNCFIIKRRNMKIFTKTMIVTVYCCMAAAFNLYSDSKTGNEKMSSLQDQKKNEPVIITPEGSGYNSWPFIRTLGKRLVCAYSRGSEHTVDEPARGVFARVSDDGGKTWLPETTVTNSREYGEIAEGSGLDANGDMLLFVRVAGPRVTHDLYRSKDGINFARIAVLELNPIPMQIMDVIHLGNGDLMTFWFSGVYKNTQNGAWGTLVSKDNGVTWTQRTIESDLTKEEWPTEHSGIIHPDGRILVVARAECSSKIQIAQFQLESEDNGVTWKKYRTNIENIFESTPALLYDRQNGLLSNYYYQRLKGILWRRVVKFDDIWHNPRKWPDCELVITASPNGCDAGNVKGTLFGEKHALALYSGNETQTAIVTLVIPPPVK